MAKGTCMEILAASEDHNRRAGNFRIASQGIDQEHGNCYIGIALPPIELSKSINYFISFLSVYSLYLLSTLPLNSLHGES